MIAVGVMGFAWGSPLVEVTQFYMAQCPMSSTLLSDFHWRCMENGEGIKVCLSGSCLIKGVLPPW